MLTLLEELARRDQAAREQIAVDVTGRIVNRVPAPTVLPELVATGKPWLVYALLALGAYWLITSKGGGKDWT